MRAHWIAFDRGLKNMKSYGVKAIYEETTPSRTRAGLTKTCGVLSKKGELGV